MTTQIPQHLLDELTDVRLPRDIREGETGEVIEVSGVKIPVYRCAAVVLGSGAAGLRAAVELKRRGVDVLVVTRKLFWGTSAFSGSDKQTLHTACTKHHGDDFTKMAQALGGGGAMDADVAYVEAVGSIDAFAGLKYLGLPLPQDRYGAVLRYQTDHDEYGRATSCGPRTSRLMVKVLAEEAIRLGIPFLDHSTAMSLVKSGSGAGEKATGLVILKRDDHRNPYGLSVVLSPNVVLASGGPGELYRDSVYPKNCFGSLGLALEAGIELSNLTEHQFGIGTRRTEFPWNLSGTYVQVMPNVYSTDAADGSGEQHNFLGDYYRTTQELVSNVFRKGYQWPFHASRTLDFASSLVDLAIFDETRKGRTVWLDFLRNPQAVPGDLPFDLARLDPDVRAYLENNNALLDTPIARLQRMNPLAIELYKQYRRDITREPLQFNVNHQHMNGGVDVDIFARSSLEGCYAVGEIAGTHGVTRPGGAALNAGQVFGQRCAAHVQARLKRLPPGAQIPGELPGELTGILAASLGWLARNVGNAKGIKLDALGEEIQNRMSDCAGFVCRTNEVEPALAAARKLNERIARDGVYIDEDRHISDGVLRVQTALLSEAVLAALAHYIEQGGGSRGARMLCAPGGTKAPMARLGALDGYRFLAENEAQRSEKIRLRYDPQAGMQISERPLRPIEDTGKIYFEKNWGAFLTGEIYPE